MGAVATVAWLATDHQQLMYLLSQGWRWSTRCPRRSTCPRNRIRSRWSLERCSLLQGEVGNEQLVSLLTSTPPRPRGTSRCRACSPPPTCRCSSSPPRSLRSSSSRTPSSPPPPPLATSSQSL